MVVRDLTADRLEKLEGFSTGYSLVAAYSPPELDGPFDESRATIHLAQTNRASHSCCLAMTFDSISVLIGDSRRRVDSPLCSDLQCPRTFR